MTSNLPARLAAVFILLAALVAVPGAGAQTAAALDGVYNGTYRCAQGVTQLKLSLEVSPAGDVSALFTFYLPPGTRNQGYTYSLHGQYNAQTAKLSLTPQRWETQHPANFGMVGMNGSFASNALSGMITGGRCGEFNVSRDAVESAIIASVMAAQKSLGTPPAAPPAPPSPAVPPPAPAQDRYAAALQAQAPNGVKPPPSAPAPPAAKSQPPAAKPPAPPAPARKVNPQVAQQRPAPAAPAPPAPKAPTAPKTQAQAGAKPGKPSTDADLDKLVDDLAKSEAALTNPVLSWKLATIKDPATGGSSPHPTADTMFSPDGEADVSATASCSSNGVSVFFVLDSVVADAAPGFVWYDDDYGDTVADVRVRVDGSTHMAKGFPDEEQDKLYNNSMGIFFYAPSLAERAARARELESRTGTPLDGLLGSITHQAAQQEAQDAAASSAGPVANLLNARNIRVDFTIEDFDDVFLELNPQDKVLHKFVTDCSAHFK